MAIRRAFGRGDRTRLTDRLVPLFYFAFYLFSRDRKKTKKRKGFLERHQEWERERDGYVISTDPGRLDHDAILALLADTYWARNIPSEVLRRSIGNAHPFGLYRADGRQVGYARVVTDYVRFAWLSDVVVGEEERGHGLGKWLVGTILDHEPLRHVDRWLLVTEDAHDLYRRYGFSGLRDPGRFMIRQGS